MSRSFVLLLIPETIERTNLSEYVKQFFFPFDREFKFPPFKSPCFCIDQDERIRYANKKIRHFHQFWRSYTLIHPSQRPDWAEYIRTWVTAALTPPFDSPPPDPACPYCNGLGVYTTTNYSHNMYDYWVGLKEELLGYPSQLTPQWVTHELSSGRTLRTFRLLHPSHKPFDIYHIITPDGRPVNRWDFSNVDAWGMAWESVVKEWTATLVVRCLIHE